MNTITFNWTRFLNLCKCEFAENRTQYLRWYGIMSVFICLLFFIEGEDGSGFFFRPAVLIFSVFLFQNLEDWRRRAFYLMIPASVPEKFFSRYAYVMGLIFIVWGLSYLTGWLGYGVISSLLPGNEFVWQSPWSGVDTNDLRYNVWFFFTIQAVFMLGSSIWLKGSWIKTILFHAAFGIFLFAGVMITTFIYKNFLEDSGFLIGTDFSWFMKVVPYIHGCMLALFYGITYFRFRELRLYQEKNPLKSPSLRIVLGCYFLLWLVICGAALVAMSHSYGNWKFYYKIDPTLIF